MTDYIAIIHKDPESDFGVSFPDFPGCTTVGRTLDEAKDMAAEALQFHIQGMVEDGDEIPYPSSLDAVMADPDAKSGAALIVSAELPSKPLRVNVLLEERLLKAIASVNDNRSKFLTDAAWEKLRRSV